MFDVDVPLLTHESKRIRLREAGGEHGLIAVGVGRAGGRGFQMLHRFAALGDQLDAAGVNLVFAYPAQSARHVQDALSVLAARYRGKPCLLLDEAGLFFGDTLPPQWHCVMRFDRDMTCIETATIAAREEGWDALLSEFLIGVLEDVA
ncbi:hypothetical protein [Paraburkholderia tagetis]|uniref:Uncharacterized protein n=1 Tax=Paraburkholderia tagetis TaxID=2913261 RepID=A0A9X1RN78_9BURK|nr:hypothetical protein [Paraburkholderia tagetis]MCG5075436.1 hypothetical protein [Paraburkholderia tagetis]